MLATNYCAWDLFERAQMTNLYDFGDECIAYRIWNNHQNVLINVWTELLHFVYENKENQRECGLTHMIFQTATAYNSQVQFDLFPTGNVMFAGRFVLNFDNIMVFVRKLGKHKDHDHLPVHVYCNLWCFAIFINNCSEQQIFEEVSPKMVQTVMEYMGISKHDPPLPPLLG